MDKIGIPNREQDPSVQGLQTPELKEGELLDIKFYVTDHSPRHSETGSREQLEQLYKDIKKDGINFIRYDWDWNIVQPTSNRFDGGHLDRYQEAKVVMERVGLEPPTIILSNVPDWAKELYQNNKQAFFKAYAEYVRAVKSRLESSGGKKIEKIQILNEFNNKIYNPVATEDLPRLCEITREIFQTYNPNTQLMGSLIVGNVTDLSSRFNLGTGIDKYLPEFKKIKDSFDTIAVDYYPGLWHLPLKEIDFKWHLSPAQTLKEVTKTYKQMDFLKDTMKKIASWGKDYELAEVGLPTNSLFGDEKNQRYFFDLFFRALKHMLLEFQAQHLRLPSRIGLYEAIDEPPRDPLGNLLSPIHPEFHLGMRRPDTGRKEILQGNRHNQTGPSQLSNIIRYLRSPMQRSSKSTPQL